MASDLHAQPRQKLSIRVVSTLRAQLLAGEIPPGQKLPTENQLSEQFGVSRTVVREAIATLAADGLVQSRQGAGVFVVNHPTAGLGMLAAEMGSRVSTALNVLEVRLGIEVECAALAALRRNPSQEALIQEAFFEFERLLRLDQPTGPADFAFHRAIAEATNNPFYVEMLDALGKRTIPCDVTSPWTTELVQSLDFQRSLQHEHHAILSAISAGDTDAARAAMRAHLSRSQARYRTRLHERTAHYAMTTKDEQ
jgi:GntR family transcriptional regulator, transcriptional repressor for pyruvate dehydrogenase complex